MNDENRRTAVVTGGTGGLGLAVSEAMADAGYRTIVTWVLDREAEQARSALGDQIELRRLDVTNPEEANALAAELDDSAGCWALVHLVGGYLDDTPLGQMTLDEWQRQLDLNATSAAVMMGAFLPGMVRRGGGRVVAVSSRAAVAPFAGGSAYAAGKAALIALVHAASQEVKHDGVTVNCVIPSVIDTPGNRAAQPDADTARWVAPADLAAVIAFLCSDGARAVTGAAIPVYGRA
jgi:NAD(P)-dependent dehydrogenase (short-subunit alcohol dehydrogenase family)